MIKYVVTRISQEIFVFPSEYFIYQMFRALFWRVSWSTNILYAPTSRRFNFSINWVLWTPIDLRMSSTSPGSRPWLMSTTACWQETAWLPGHVGTGVQVWHSPVLGKAEMHSDFWVYRHPRIWDQLKEKKKIKHLFYVTSISAGEIFNKKPKHF